MSVKPTGVHYGNPPGETGPAHYWGPKSDGAPAPTPHPLSKVANDAAQQGGSFVPPTKG